MRRWAPVIAIWCVIALAYGAAAQSTELRERYLDKPRGPYRGKVIDAETRAPIVGAVVVAHWYRDRVGPFHSVMEHYAVREVLTDADGVFVIDAKQIEEGAPRRTYHPEFLIFMPGYGSYPRFQKAPTGFIGGVFEGAGVVVELPRLKSPEDRRKHLLRVNPMTPDPLAEVPQLMRKIDEERVSIGLTPALPKGKP
ncbi:MAG TPA: hypothetical protein VF578_07455 [Methylomirabilota bacterium]